MKIIGLDRAPSSGTIREAASRPPESYLRRLNNQIIGAIQKGSLTVDVRGMKTGSQSERDRVRGGDGSSFT